VLREALRALAIMKVVAIRQGSGTYVTSLEPSQLVSHLEFASSTDTVALGRLQEARRVVEVGNVRLAAQRAQDADISVLESILARLKGAVDDAATFRDLDISFHDALCATADNYLLTQFMAVINTLARVSRERTGALRSVREATVLDHGRILDALRSRNPDAAARAMHDHLDHVEQSLDDSIEHARDRQAPVPAEPVG
jgi:GntR family transcriptional repressor for pyruvate dehydrogenase complex